MGKLFDGNLLAGLAMTRRYDRTVSALSDELNCLVLQRKLEHYSLEVSARESWDVRLHRNSACLLSCSS